MARYGDLDKVLELVNEVYEDGNFTSYAHYSYLFDSIDNLPAVKQLESRDARWVKVDIGWKCSNCTLCTNIKGKTEFNYCPNCGARMDGESDAND